MPEASGPAVRGGIGRGIGRGVRLPNAAAPRPAHAASYWKNKEVRDRRLEAFKAWWTSLLVGSTVVIRGDARMDTQQIVEAFRMLPADEWVRLVEELWDEVAREIEQRPLSEAQRRLLDERIRQHEEMPTDVEAWESARDDLLRDL